MASRKSVENPLSVSGVPSAERALQVLTAFRRGDSDLSLAELAARTGLVKSTIMRLAVSLQRFGLLTRLPDGAYRLGAETLRLGTAYLTSFDLADHVVPMLDRLMRATGETASFYVRHGADRLCLFRAESDSPIRMHVQPGDVRPLDDSASGQIFRQAEAGALDELALPVFTSGATDAHAASLAMPIMAADGALAGVLLISGPVSRLTSQRSAEIGALLVDAATALTRVGGGVPPAISRPPRRKAGAGSPETTRRGGVNATACKQDDAGGAGRPAGVTRMKRGEAPYALRPLVAGASNRSERRS